MKKVLIGIVLTMGIATLANAQATRTWVSGVGDDVNPCSRTAPCKTFAGAISKTALGGIINCLDPGGFGAVTVTKAIELDCTGTLGSILNSGVSGVVVNALTTSKVVLRDLQINGAGTTLGLQGVNILQAGQVHVYNCSIANQSTAGIRTANSSNQITVIVDDTEILASTTGILAASTLTGTTLLAVSDSNISNNSSRGIEIASGNSGAQVSNTVLSKNITDGFKITPGTSGAALESCNISFNGNGVNVATAGGEVRLSRNTIHQNFTNGVTGLGTTRCFGTNVINANVGNQTCTLANQAQQ